MVQPTDRDPLPPEEYVLSLEETREFQEKIIWEAVNYLWNGDFRNGAKAGEDVHFRRKVIDVDGPVRVQITAEAWNEYDGDDIPIDEPVLMHSTLVRLERMSTSLTDLMIETMNKWNEEMGVDNAVGGAADIEAGQSTDEDQGLLQTWKISQLYVDDSTNGVIEIRHFHELQDVDGDVVYDDTFLSRGIKDGEPLTGDEYDELKQLSECMAGSLTFIDKCRTMAMFAIVGLPTGLPDVIAESN